MSRLSLASIAVFITSWFTHIGVVTDSVEGVIWSIITAIVLGFINLTIKPVISFVSIPITLITLGLFSLVINGAMILLAGFFLEGFNIPSLASAIYFGLILGIVNWFFHLFDYK